MIVPTASRPWLELESVDSTQILAASYVRRELDGPIPGVITANHQTGGKGRQNRVWFSQPGTSLAMSLILSEYADHAKPWLLGMAVAAATACALHLELRWPNDLGLNGKKVGGILSEIIRDPEGRGIPIVGVGVNLSVYDFPAEIADIATSYHQHRADVLTPKAAAEKILKRLETMPDPSEWSDLRPIWMMFDQTPGKRFVLPDGSIATAVSIGPEGQLLASVEGEMQEVFVADGQFGHTPA